MAPSVPPLPSGQTGRNSALMTGDTSTRRLTNDRSAALVRTLSLRVGRRPSSPAAEPDCAARRIGSSGERRGERREVRVGALARVVARARVGDQERPVRALQREQLAQRARRRVGAERGQLGAALRPGELRARSRSAGRGPRPSSSGGTSAGRADAGGRRRRARRPRARARASRNVTPSCQWWPKSSVSKATTAPSATSRDEVLGVARGRGRRRARGRRASPSLAQAWWARGVSRLRVAVVAVRRVAARVPDEVDRRRGRAGRARSRPRCGCGSGCRPTSSLQSTHVTCTPASSSSSSSHGACAHSGSQKPPSQAPKRRRCDAIPVSSCRRTPASVASSGSTAWVAALTSSSTCGAKAAIRSPRRSSASAACRVARAPSRRARRERVAARRARARRGRTSRRNVRQRSSAPGASSWSASTGRDAQSVTLPGWRSSTSSSGR